MTKSRRRSIDSSDSDSSSNSDHSKEKKYKKDKDKKDRGKQEKKDKKDHKEGHLVSQGGPSAHGFSSPPFLPPTFDLNREQAVPPSFPAPHSQPALPVPSHPPPTYDTIVTPPSGFRLPLTTTSVFPDIHKTGPPPFYDADGHSPIFIGSALFERSVQPCKIGPHLSPFALVPYGGGEYGHNGRFDLLPFDSHTMEWVYTSHGRVPPGRRPVEGGYEENGQKLYHGLAAYQPGVKVPGKAGEHLYGSG